MRRRPPRGRVGLIADEESVCESLAEVLHQGGFEIACEQPVDGLSLPLLQDERVDAWIAVPPADPARAGPLENLLRRAGVRHHLEPPDDIAQFGEAFIHWQQRLLQDVTGLLGRPRPEPEIRYTRPTATRASAAGELQLLVLASSLGGPPAVKAFLDALQPDLPFGMLYAQHIEPEQLDSLARVLARHSHYQLQLAQPGDVVQPGTVLLVPVAQRLDVAAGGILKDPGAPWAGPYRPCLDQVIDAAARAYGRRAGVVVFSGMGEDGSAAARRLEQAGGPVWAQDAASSGCSSMPDAVRAACHRPYSGPPAALASNISLRYCAAAP